MASARIPPLLEPYLRLPPEAALVVLTSVLGCSANWLVLRWAYGLLSGRQQSGRQQKGQAADDGEGDGDAAVVLCSFLQDGAFWREGLSSLGLDLDNLQAAKRFSFVDGLTGLYAPDPDPEPATGAGRHHVLLSSTVDHVARTLEAAIAEVSGGGRRVVLVMDHMDAWLATADESASDVAAMLAALRERVHAAVVTVAADEALVQAQNTTLEKEHAALVLSLAHEAHLVVGLRRLDTGTSGDVSGVVRMTGGGRRAGRLEDAEYLYRFSGDGGVKVFERGA
ncbi:uncharacterized protein UV8b_04371 [Ustilaginoidea virens]|uniref:Elongator complex protein 6 n=1 Tax=Ustilaginoidea virens TaxID=1159556 RepID=A0A8E5HRP6_USTVR|nr:uncharacterized protein UV8b_04371 [Ustilaginoidea virens]QUC20130.1 hypothetical protein UV8b_04371 [Ustilaginoidea virens]